jgi:hypothetical protein
LCSGPNVLNGQRDILEASLLPPQLADSRMNLPLIRGRHWAWRAFGELTKRTRRTHIGSSAAIPDAIKKTLQDWRGASDAKDSTPKTDSMLAAP